MNLTLGITNQCTQTCEHCCLSSSPNDKRKLTAEEMCRYIDETYEVSKKNNDKFSLSFSGGDPFLEFEYMLEVTRYAMKKANEGIGCVSNGYWAQTTSLAEKKLSIFMGAGLRRLGISTDPFHEKFVHFDNIKNIFRAALPLGLQLTLKTVVLKNTPRVYELLERLEDIIPESQLEIEEISCLPVGEASKLDKNFFLYRAEIPKENCRYLGDLIIHYNGDVYPCCIPGWPKLLKLGNARKQPIRELVANYHNNMLFKVLKDAGPAYFIPYLEKAGVKFTPGNYINNCHLCQEILNMVSNDEIIMHHFNEALNVWENLAGDKGDE